MKKLNLTVKQQQHATGNLIASILGAEADGAVAREFSSRLATLYGRAPKSHTQKAKADGHTDSFSVDWGTIAATIGTEQQTLNESEAGLLRSLCDANMLTLLGVVSIPAEYLAENWSQNVKLWSAVAKVARDRWQAEKEAAEKAAAPQS